MLRHMGEVLGTRVIYQTGYQGSFLAIIKGMTIGSNYIIEKYLFLILFNYVLIFIISHGLTNHIIKSGILRYF